MPASILPASASNVRALNFGTLDPNILTFLASGFSGTINWSVDGISGGSLDVGTITPTGVSVNFTPSNVTAIRTIHASDGTNNVDSIIGIVGVVPAIPHVPDDLTLKKVVLSSEAMDTTRAFRIKSGTRKAYKLNFKTRTNDEFILISKFYDLHHGLNPFFYDDLVRNVSPLVWFDSDVHSAGNSSVDFDYDFDVIEKIV